MTDVPPGPAAGPAGPPPTDDPLADPRAPQLLATEHWSLLATRSMSWNEAFSRTGTFLSTLSAAAVALALAGPAMQFNADFRLFALVVLGVVLFLGVATFIRLVQVNNEDLYWVYGMNRLRGAYARLIPGIEREFVAGHTIDPAGISKTYGAVNVARVGSLHLLVTTPAVVAVITSAIAGAIVGLLAAQLGSGMATVLGVGGAAFVIAVVMLLGYNGRETIRYIARIQALQAAAEER